MLGPPRGDSVGSVGAMEQGPVRDDPAPPTRSPGATRLMKAAAALLVGATLAYFATRSPDPRPVADVQPLVTDSQPAEAMDLAAGEELADAAPRRLAAAPEVEPEPEALPVITGARVLRVVLEGLADADPSLATVTLTGVDEHLPWPGWPPEVADAWTCRGSTNEFDLDPFFAKVAEHGGGLRVDELMVEVEHPVRFSRRTRVVLSRGVERPGGQTVHEVTVRLDPPVYWPEFSLSVRDAQTRAHLDHVELRCRTTAWMGLGELPGEGFEFTRLGDDLGSPVALLGGYQRDDPEAWVAGLALRPPTGETARPADLHHAGRVQPERGILMFARAPGYAWGRAVLDVSTGAEREILLRPAATLDVHLANVQLDRYAEHETQATLLLDRPDPEGGETGVWSRALDPTVEAEGVRVDGLPPGDYSVSVELGGRIAWRKQPELAREEFTLAPGETRELVLMLADAPAPRALTTLGGTVSFPSFAREQDARLEFYRDDYRYGDADLELWLRDMPRVAGALPTWSFEAEDVPAGRYQIQLVPFLKSWMVELPAAGRDDIELVIPELAEVLVETVDGRSGARLPFEEIRYGHRQELAGQVHFPWSTAERVTTGYEGEPGRFHYWTVPGPAYLQTWRIPDGVDVGMGRQDLELVPGLQSVRFELAPPSGLSFEFRVDGAALPTEDAIFNGLSRGIRAVGHEGRAMPIKYWYYEATRPGLYEISFEGVGADRFEPIPPRVVELRAGETTEVVVELQRR